MSSIEGTITFTYSKNNAYYAPNSVEWKDLRGERVLELGIPALVVNGDFNVYKTSFSFIPETSGIYKFYSFDNGGCDPDAYLKDENSYNIAYNDDGGEGYNFLIEEYLEAGKTYYLDARGSGSYYVKVELVEIEELELGTSVLVENKAIFSFTPTTSGIYKFYSFDNDGCDPDGYLYDEYFDQITYDYNSGEGYNFLIEPLYVIFMLSGVPI
ncbi:MAG: hypothetical protein FWG51_01630 [Firmicutes bacterium]|nr:hypothetical protein [Bacillota bacterium]